MASKDITEIEGIGPSYKDKLAAANISKVEHLLDFCCTKSARKSLAEQTGISERLILKWTNMADLFRIKGVGGEYAELLEQAGVDTVKELRTRRPDNLAKKMEEVNQEKKLTRRVPSESVVTGWVEEAAKLPPKVEH